MKCLILLLSAVAVAGWIEAIAEERFGVMGAAIIGSAIVITSAGIILIVWKTRK